MPTPRSIKFSPSEVIQRAEHPNSFYRDQDNKATLRDHGFMTEWAKRAGSLVFQDAEALNEDNIVTFCILGTFWYSQGHWQLSYLHKGLCLPTDMTCT